MSEYEVELYCILGDMIRKERIARDITLEQLAEKLGVTTKTVQRYERGERKIKLNTLMQITDLFGLDYNEFMAQAKTKLVGGVPKNGQSIGYYLDDEVAEMAQEIHDNPDLRILFDASRKVSKEDLQLVVDMVKRLKGDD